MMFWFIAGLVLSGFIGLSLGLIGGGGSILTVPILVYFLGVSPQEAVAMSLAVVGATSVFGSMMHLRSGNVDLKRGVLFGGAGIIGAFLGAPFTRMFSPNALLLLFGTLMLVVAASMLWRSRRSSEGADAERRVHAVQAVLAGIGIGFVTGFLGVGGGFLIVPALILFGGLDTKKAIGTSLLVISLNSFAGLIGHLGHQALDMWLTTIVLVTAVAGTIGGTMLSNRLGPQRLQRVFAAMVTAVGAFLVARNYTSAF